MACTAVKMTRYTLGHIQSKILDPCALINPGRSTVVPKPFPSGGPTRLIICKKFINQRVDLLPANVCYFGRRTLKTNRKSWELKQIEILGKKTRFGATVHDPWWYVLEFDMENVVRFSRLATSPTGNDGFVHEGLWRKYYSSQCGLNEGYDISYYTIYPVRLRSNNTYEVYGLGEKNQEKRIREVIAAVPIVVHKDYLSTVLKATP